MTTDTTDWPKRLRELRVARRETQEDLARVLDVSVRSVARWEAGESTPRQVWVQRMIEAFEREAAK